MRDSLRPLHLPLVRALRQNLLRRRDHLLPVDAMRVSRLAIGGNHTAPVFRDDVSVAQDGQANRSGGRGDAFEGCAAGFEGRGGGVRVAGLGRDYEGICLVLLADREAKRLVG